MCVICIKPKGIELPSKENMRAMYLANHDGCGFCTPSQYFRTLSFESFMQRIRQVSKDEPCIMHFRLATHGSVKRANCHPFYDKETDVYFAHNGILDVWPDKDKTDSETAFLRILKPEIMAHGYKSDELKYAVRQIIGGSKFALLKGDELQIFGDYHTYENCLYSNLRFAYYMNLRHL